MFLLKNTSDVTDVLHVNTVHAICECNTFITCVAILVPGVQVAARAGA